jgi:hypothetical protein
MEPYEVGTSCYTCPTQSQLMGIIFIIAGIICFWFAYRTYKRDNEK